MTGVPFYELFSHSVRLSFIISQPQAPDLDAAEAFAFRADGTHIGHISRCAGREEVFAYCRIDLAYLFHLIK